MSCLSGPINRRNHMKRSTLILAVTMALAFSSPAFAQRSHPGGGPPAGRGPGSDSGVSGSHEAGAPTSHADMSHASPSDVLSHNSAIGGKIKTLTGQDVQTACTGFKNIGQCVAAAHVEIGRAH